MTDVNAVVDRYVAGWNESDPAARRLTVTTDWAADAVHYTPTREFHGHTALEERLAEAYNQFVAGGTFRFRSQHNVVANHDAVKFNWAMVSADGSEKIAAIGFDLLLLDGEGRIQADWQFLDPVPDSHSQAVADSYLALWNGDERGQEASLWAEDSLYFDHNCIARGPAEIGALIGKAQQDFTANEVVFRFQGSADGHHNAVRLPWVAMTPDGAVAAKGLEFLVLGPDGRISLAYQFVE